MTPDAADDLLAFIDAAPTPYHAVAESVRRLEARGFRPLLETETWTLSPGDRVYLVRNDGSLVAIAAGDASPAVAGFRLLGAHTDSPNLRVKPRPDLSESGYGQLALEPYGGVLLYTWLDRDLSLAGRVAVLREGRPETTLVDFGAPLLRVPSLAIHLQREIREEGLKLNPQLHMNAMLTVGSGAPFAETVARQVEQTTGKATRADDVIGFDLMAYDTTPAARCGAGAELIAASRLDNLASCHAALTALSRICDNGGAATRAIVLYDHEEVGSRSAQGAESPLLRDVLARVMSARNLPSDDLPRALACSTLVSVDMAHALHPNFSDRHERGHRPVIGGGPVLKVNVNQSYATDARTAGVFGAACRKAELRFQHFVARSDLGCGSTIGPIASARSGIATVDVGNPMLAMHSCRETAGVADVEPMIRVLAAFLED
jgi:aspartyl aminopeptidase